MRTCIKSIFFSKRCIPASALGSCNGQNSDDVEFESHDVGVFYKLFVLNGIIF